MATSKDKRPSQLPSQEDDTLHHTTVSTPDIEVSLVDRMKKRFSSRNASTQDAGTDGELETTTSTVPSSEMPAAKTGPRKRTSKRTSLGQKVTQIDKLFSPDARTSRVFRSPTRFPSDPGSLAPGATASSESDEGPMDVAGRSGESSDDARGSGSQSSVDRSTDESDPRYTLCMLMGFHCAGSTRL